VHLTGIISYYLIRAVLRSVGMTLMPRVDVIDRQPATSDNEMARLIGAWDWASTPLGQVQGWSRSLRAVVSLLLDSHQPMAIGWGADLAALYNDGFLPIVGDRHPALGKPLAEVFGEVWERARPLALAALAGEAQHLADQKVAPPGQPARWFSLSWTPLRDDSGDVAGVYCTATDTTAKVEALASRRASEEQLAREASAMARLSEASSRLWRAATLREGLDEMLGAAIDLLGADKGSVRLWDAQRGVLSLAAQRGFEPAFADRFQEVRLEDDKDGRALHAGERIVIENIDDSAGFAAYLSFAAGVRALQTTPLISPDGKLLGVLSTHFSAPHRPADQDLQRLDLYARQAADFIARVRIDEALRFSEERLRTIVDTAVDAVIVIDDRGGIQSINPAGERIFGYPHGELIGQNISVLMTATDHVGHDSYLRAYLKTGKARIIGIGREVETRRKDGSVFTADLAIAEWHHAGKRYFTGTLRDITERKRHEDAVKLLLREVNHRAKNLLALVQAIARQTVATRPQDFVTRFEERIYALAASQDLLVKTEWKGADLEKLVRSQLAHFEDLIDSRIRLAGEPLFISASAAQTIGMALHELATNAGKYGALSAEGQVDIEWRLERGGEGEDTFVMGWRERGGPAVVPPTRTGFGTTVMGRMAELSLGGKVELSYPPEGLVWRLRSPAHKVVEGAKLGGAGEAVTARPGVAPGSRPRVLVVEDEVFIALEISEALIEAGFDVVGPAMAVGPALELMDTVGCDAAVLDINLGTETSEPVARGLARRGTRFVTLSGYSREQHPGVFLDAPSLAKPLRPQALVAELKRVIFADTAGNWRQ
jgi:PAS domain S-box-containing protein